MRKLLLLFAMMGTAGELNGQERPEIVSQSNVSAIACGPCSIYNWLSHGDQELADVLSGLSSGKSSIETVNHIIGKYGSRPSATKSAVSRYGPHNGGVGSVNLLVIAREILDDHCTSPPELRGDYLQNIDNETPRRHLDRVRNLFSDSIESGVPVILYLRGYQPNGSVNFGHHVVITSIGTEITKSKTGQPGIAIKLVDPSGGTTVLGWIRVAEREFTATTYSYHLIDGKATTTSLVVTGRPLLEVFIPARVSPRAGVPEIVVAHFATYALANDTGPADPVKD